MQGSKIRVNGGRFRNSMTSSAGHTPALSLQAKITNVNMVNWTVDVVSQFDRHWFSDIQVLSPYLHPNNGEGIYVMPEVGAVCQICVPSDSSPPYVLGFLAPMETSGGNQLQDPSDPSSASTTAPDGTQTADPDAGTSSDAPAGTRSRGGSTPSPNVDASFAAGRPPSQPGDIVMRTRDGNFLILHRGGVLSYGSTELAQRIYIPIGDKILDVSKDYTHQNIGGTIHWGLQQGPSIQNPACEYVETYRLFANDQYASIKLSKGKVLNPVGEPPATADDVQTYGIGTDPKFPLTYELAIVPGGPSGFLPVSGDVSDSKVQAAVTLRIAMDLKGNVRFRSLGSAAISFGNRLKVSVANDFVVRAKDLDFSASNTASFGGENLTSITGDLVKFSAGPGQAAARMGDAVTISMAGVTLTGTLTSVQGNGAATFVILTATPAPGGAITTGNTNIQM